MFETLGPGGAGSGSYLTGMTNQDASVAAIRFDASDEDWMIATVNGTRLGAAPVRTDDIDATILELVAQLGVRTRVEIRYADGQIERRVAYPRPSATALRTGEEGSR